MVSILASFLFSPPSSDFARSRLCTHFSFAVFSHFSFSARIVLSSGLHSRGLGQFRQSRFQQYAHHVSASSSLPVFGRPVFDQFDQFGFSSFRDLGFSWCYHFSLSVRVVSFSILSARASFASPVSSSMHTTSQRPVACPVQSRLPSPSRI